MSWGEIMNFMFETCPECGCLLNNSPDCDPEIGNGGCAHRETRGLTCQLVPYKPGEGR